MRTTEEATDRGLEVKLHLTWALDMSDISKGARLSGEGGGGLLSLKEQQEQDAAGH